MKSAKYDGDLPNESTVPGRINYERHIANSDKGSGNFLNSRFSFSQLCRLSDKRIVLFISHSAKHAAREFQIQRDG